MRIGPRILIAASLTLASCSTAALERRTLPAALADHVASLPAFDHRAHVVVPESTAWSVAMRTIRAMAPIARFDAQGPWIQTGFRYDVRSNDGLRVQTRTRYDVTFVRDGRRGLLPSVRGTRERRSRTLCGPTTAWSSTGDVPNLEGAIEGAISSLQDVPYEQFVFAEAPAELAGHFADALGPGSTYQASKSVDADGTPMVDGIGRVSGAQRRDVQIEVQSSFRARFYPAPGGSRVVVEAVLEHRTSDEDVMYDFVQDDPARVREAVYAFLAQVVPVLDVTVPAESWDLAVDPQEVEADLAPADDDLNGTYRAQLYFAAAPYVRPDGRAWDEFDEPPAGIVPGVGVPVLGDPRVLVPGARALALANPPLALPDFLSGLRAYSTAAPTSLGPDLVVAFDVAGATTLSPVATETYAAMWPDSQVTLSLHGDGPIHVRLVDQDGPVTEDILATSIGARQLLASCRPVCLEANYGAVCLALDRAD